MSGYYHDPDIEPFYIRTDPARNYTEKRPSDSAVFQVPKENACPGTGQLPENGLCPFCHAGVRAGRNGKVRRHAKPTWMRVQSQS